MNKDDILVCIANHNSNQNAIQLKKGFGEYFDTIIIDSKSTEISDEFDIKLDNVYYTGLVNESINQSKIRKKQLVFFIASDVYVEDFEKISQIIKTLPEDVYLWAPSSRGQSHYHCKNFKSDGLREVPYLEGFTFLSNLALFENLYPISTVQNLYGFGIDLTLGFNCIKKFNKICVVDDRIEVYHKEGTGYDQSRALNDMYRWMMSSSDLKLREYTVLYSQSWDSKINSSDWKKLLNYLKS